MSGMSWQDAIDQGVAEFLAQEARRSALAEREAALYADDPFPGPTPPTAEEQSRVASDAALLSAAAGRLERQIADGRVDQLFTGLVAWLRDAAREAVEIGSNGFAVALARKIMGEGS